MLLAHPPIADAQVCCCASWLQPCAWPQPSESEVEELLEEGNDWEEWLEKTVEGRNVKKQLDDTSRWLWWSWVLPWLIRVALVGVFG